jgi:predicted metal-binding protein
MIDPIAKAVELGAEEATFIDPQDVVTAPWVRLKCRFGCDGYGECRTCPPHSPPPDETRRLLDGYRKAVLLKVGPHTGYDESGTWSARVRRAATTLERELFLDGRHRAWSLGCGPCEECEDCDMSVPCIHPEQARPSMEAAGIDVFSTVRNAGWQIHTVRSHDDDYSFFSLVLVD